MIVCCKFRFSLNAPKHRDVLKRKILHIEHWKPNFRKQFLTVKYLKYSVTENIMRENDALNSIYFIRSELSQWMFCSEKFRIVIFVNRIDLGLARMTERITSSKWNHFPIILKWHIQDFRLRGFLFVPAIKVVYWMKSSFRWTVRIDRLNGDIFENDGFGSYLNFESI